MTRRQQSPRPARPARTQHDPVPAAVPAPPPASPTDVRLTYAGGADLVFRDGSGARRRIRRGEAFAVDVATAAVLLATDPAVSEADEAPIPPSVGSTSRSSEPEPTEVPASTEDGESKPDEPTDASSDADAADAPEEPAESDEPPEPEPFGPITLGDLPAGAKVHEQR